MSEPARPKGETHNLESGFAFDQPTAFYAPQTVLDADCLAALAGAFGFVYSVRSRDCPDEEEPISGIIASEYRQVALLQPQRYDTFIEPITSWQGNHSLENRDLTVVDVGSGVGLLTIELARRFPRARVIGIDVSEDMVSIANKFLKNSEPELKSRVCFQGASVYDLASVLESKNFDPADVVLSRNMLHRLRRAPDGLQQMFGAVRPGGMLYITAFCGDLDSRQTQDDLVRSVKQRFHMPSGEYFAHFSRCYLSAVLRAPGRVFYEELLRDLVASRQPSFLSTEYHAYRADIRLVM